MWVYLIKNRVIVWKWRSVETFICAAPVFRVSRFQFYSIFMWKLNSIVVVGRRRHPFKLRLQTWRYGFIIVLRLHSDSQIYILLRRERAFHSVKMRNFTLVAYFHQKFRENKLYWKCQSVSEFLVFLHFGGESTLKNFPWNWIFGRLCCRFA